MATVRATVNSSLRKLGRLAAGREPRAADRTDTLAALQGMYLSWIAAGSFGRLDDVVPTGTTYIARGGERIYRRGGDTISVTLPELVSDVSYSDYGARRTGYYGTTITVASDGDDTIVTVEPSQPLGSAVPPRDGACVVIADDVGGQTLSWVYDGHVKRWQRLDMLQLDDEAPRSRADPEGLAAMLALEVADEFGAEVGVATQRQAARYLAAMTQQFGMTRVAVPGVYC